MSNSNGINVVSLFNGMGTLRQAMENLGIMVNKYYSSEIKPFAIKLQQYHFPDVIQVRILVFSFFFSYMILFYF